MALTQISTGGVKDDAVTAGKIPAGAVGSSEIAKPIDLADDEKIRVGTGNDLQIYHDGSDSYIRNTTNTDLRIQNIGNAALDIYNQNSYPIIFTTNGSERAKVSSNGTLLVGLSSDLTSNNAKLQVAHTDGNADIIVHRAGDNANPPSFNFQKTRNASIGNYGTVVQDDDELGSIRWGGADGSAIAFAARIVGSVDGTPGSNDMPGRLTFHTSGDGNENLNERMRIDSSGNVGIGGTPSFTDFGSNTGGLELDNVASSNTAVKVSHDTTDLYLAADATRGYIGTVSNDDVRFITNGTTALTLDSSQNATFAGTVSDSKGNLRSIPNDTKTSAYTLVASDAGKCIRITTGGVTVPNSVFAEGDAVTIINQSGSDQTITAGSGFTLYNSGDGSAGSKTLAGRGMATLMFAASDAAYMSGAGLS